MASLPQCGYKLKGKAKTGDVESSTYSAADEKGVRVGITKYFADSKKKNSVDSAEIYWFDLSLIGVEGEEFRKQRDVAMDEYDHMEVGILNGEVTLPELWEEYNTP